METNLSIGKSQYSKKTMNTYSNFLFSPMLCLYIDDALVLRNIMRKFHSKYFREFIKIKLLVYLHNMKIVRHSLAIISLATSFSMITREAGIANFLSTSTAWTSGIIVTWTTFRFTTNSCRSVTTNTTTIMTTKMCRAKSTSTVITSTVRSTSADWTFDTGTWTHLIYWRIFSDRMMLFFTFLLIKWCSYSKS